MNNLKLIFIILVLSTTACAHTSLKEPVAEPKPETKTEEGSRIAELEAIRHMAEECNMDSLQRTTSKCQKNYGKLLANSR